MKKLLFPAVLATVALLTFSAGAQSEFTKFTPTVAANTTTNAATPSNRVTLQSDKALTIVTHVGCASTNFGTFSLGFDLSLDGLLWTTLPVATSATYTGNPGTTNFVGYAILSTNITANFRFIRHSQIVGGTNDLTVQKIQYRFQRPTQ